MPFGAIPGFSGHVLPKIDFARPLDERATLDEWLKITPAKLHSIDSEGRLVQVSDAWLAMLGYRREEVIGRLSSEFLTPDSRADAVRHVLPEFYRTGHCENVEYQMVSRDGCVIEILLSAILHRGATADGCFALAVITDVTSRKVAERRLAVSEARYRLLADNSTDMVFQLDIDLVSRYVSPASCEILGYEPWEMTGVALLESCHPEDVERIALVFRSLLDGKIQRHSVVHRVRHREGRWIWIEAQMRALVDVLTGRPSGVMGAFRDISARKSIEDKLAEANRRFELLASLDSLTGLANRRAFDDALARECRRARRERQSVALIMIDVDEFKSFNDRYGHPAGDQCLKKVARAIVDAIRRPGDLAARYGGEEFAALLPNTDEPGAAVTAEGIRKAVVGLAIEHEASRACVITISAGVCVLGSRAADDGRASSLSPANLLSEADRALYRAKDKGRNTTVMASKLRDIAQAKPSTAA